MQLALEEETREALGDLADLALHDAGHAVGREELAQHELEVRDEVDLEGRAILLHLRRSGRRRPGAGALQHLQLSR